MTTQKIEAFVRRGYDAYNAHQSDAHWLDYATEDVAEDGAVVDMPSGLILHGPEGLKQTLLAFSMAFPDSLIELTHIGATEDLPWLSLSCVAPTPVSCIPLLATSRQRVGRLRCISVMRTRSGTEKLPDTPATMMHLA